MAKDTMNDDVMMREHLSALADGELRGEEFAAVMAYAGTQQAQEDWRVYHLIGDALRSAPVARGADMALLGRLREQLALESGHPGLTTAPVLAPVAPGVSEPRHQSRDTAANEAVFRWKLVAGLASLAAVVALSWNVLAGLGATAVPQQGAQLAAAQPSSAPPASALMATAGGTDGQQVMLRDPRLDELLAAHKQFGSTSALQMPAGFLRNATFEAPAR